MNARAANALAALDRVGALRIAKRIAAKHGFQLEVVLARADKRMSTSRARREIIATITWTLGLSENEAGAIFGCSHDTVAHHCKRREQELQRELRGAA